MMPKIDCSWAMNTYIKYDDYKEEVVKNNISLSIKGKVQLFLFLLCKYYFILIQLILSILFWMFTYNMLWQIIWPYANILWMTLKLFW